MKMGTMAIPKTFIERAIESMRHEGERNWECDRQTPLICQTPYISCVWLHSHGFFILFRLSALWSASKYTQAGQNAYKGSLSLSFLSPNYYSISNAYSVFSFCSFAAHVRDWFSMRSVLSTCINSWYSNVPLHWLPEWKYSYVLDDHEQKILQKCKSGI